MTDPQSHQITLAYDQDGNRTQIAFPNGVTEASTVNAAGQLTKIAATAGSTTLTSFSYSYTNPATNQATALRYSMTDSSGATTTYRYDALNRLTQAAGSATASYAYDPVGNLTSGTLSGGTVNLSYDAANEITTDNGHSYPENVSVTPPVRG